MRVRSREKQQRASALLHALRSFRRLDPTDRLMLIEASILLGLARLAINMLHFTSIAGRLGSAVAESRTTEATEAAAISRRVRRAVQRAAAHLPWEFVCLPQAIAAKAMLRRRGVPATIYIGVVKQPALAAHAWVRAGDIVVTGERGSAQYTILTSFT